MANQSLAIIGGGASCVLLLAHLAQHSHAPGLRIDVYDRSGRFGRGVAYSTRHDAHLLNVRAANMSAFKDDKADFANWAHGHGFKPDAFVPRKLYGQYLEEKLADACKVLSVNFLEEDVVASTRTEENQFLINGRLYDRAVLASGNVRSLRPVIEGAVTDYYNDPWNADFNVLDKAAKIALIGSGLTAVDMILALRARDYKGSITVFSRNGILPARHVAPVAYPSFLDAESEKFPPGVLLRLIRKHVRLAASQNIPWQSVIDSLRPHTNAIWQNWPEGDRQKFMKRLLTFWNVHRHRMAPQLDDFVDDLRAAGTLAFVKANVQKIIAGPVIVAYDQNYKTDAVINCLGYRYDEGRLFDVTARLGPANFGGLFETTAIPEIREQAARLSDQLLTP